MPIQRQVDGEVIGETVEVCIDGVMAVFKDRMREMLNERGIEEPDPTPGEWYPIDNFLAVLNAVENDTGENALRKVGEATPQFIEWPEEVDSPRAGLDKLNAVYDSTHRNVDGSFSIEEAGDDEADIVSTTPYPYNWEKGFIKGTAEEFGSPFTRVEVTETGGAEKVFHVRW